MNHNIIIEDWEQIKQRIKIIWRRLNDDDLQHVRFENVSQHTINKLQEKYGYSKEQAIEAFYLADIVHYNVSGTFKAEYDFV